MQISGCDLNQERSRNFKGIKDSATQKRFYSPFLQNKLCIKKKEKNQVMTYHQTQLFSIDHKSPQCLKKTIAKTNKTKSD